MVLTHILAHRRHCTLFANTIQTVINCDGVTNRQISRREIFFFAAFDVFFSFLIASKHVYIIRSFLITVIPSVSWTRVAGDRVQCRPKCDWTKLYPFFGTRQILHDPMYRLVITVSPRRQELHRFRRLKQVSYIIIVGIFKRMILAIDPFAEPIRIRGVCKY